jgi:hypothetical protein
MRIRIVCGILGVFFLALGVIEGFRGSRPAALGGFIAAVFGLLFVIPALKSGPPQPGTFLPEIGIRYRRARRVQWLGLIAGFLGLGALGLLDQFLEPRVTSDTAFGKAALVFFSLIWFVGLISGFFAVYYADQARQVAQPSDKGAV